MKQLPGSFYQRGGRWWWKVQLPGESKPKARPLRPVGARYATRDRAVAEQVALEMLRQATLSADRPASAWDGTIKGLIARYLEWARVYYRQADGTPTKEVLTIKYALRELLKHVPNLRAEDFGPKRLKQVRQALVEEGRLSRHEINRRVQIWRRMFKWAASEELVPAHVYEALRTVDGLRRGRTPAREPEPVTSVAEAHVRAVLPYASPTVAAMIELQLLTGMRSGELVQMRPCDIDMSGPVWLYTPPRHKTAYRGYQRTVPIGRKGQQILRPFLNRPVDAYLFSPKDSDRYRRQMRSENRKTPLSCGNRPGTNRKADPARVPSDRYTSESYYRAVQYAIRAARKAGVDVPDWHPHQLRHTAATRIRKQFGLDAARAMLGHRSLQITDDYAEIDRNLAIKVASRLG